ncbi:MAG: hypothetical protein GY941_21445 [Planctomycetes bacterium]|nr:hypothetical protein [Planctomycetota bacterium]
MTMTTAMTLVTMAKTRTSLKRVNSSILCVRNRTCLTRHTSAKVILSDIKIKISQLISKGRELETHGIVKDYIKEEDTEPVDIDV